MTCLDVTELDSWEEDSNPEWGRGTSELSPMKGLE